MTRTASQITAQPEKGSECVTRSEVRTHLGATLDEADIAKLIAFFRLLDKWDLEAKRNAENM